MDIEGGTPAVTSVDGNIQITGTAGLAALSIIRSASRWVIQEMQPRA
ncbi:MAG: hypothetical protein IPK98_09720 [Chloracidobacterium sp.]|nr:hypothetical protein [Chloracidobacterium sp.]